jgi:thiamine biosynthesis lipoprotein
MLHQTEFRAMGCRIFAAIDSPSQPHPLEDLPRWFDEWEDHLSRFRPDSELNRINRANGIPTKVSAVLADVLEYALEAETLSDGLVTPVLLDALISAGYDRSFSLLPEESFGARSAQLEFIPSLVEIDWEPSTTTLWLPPDLHLDFGGVAKGWAADQAAKRLAVFGPTLVDGQGDIAISGPQSDGSPWKIGVADPFEKTENIAYLHIHKGGVATSGRDRRTWLRNGEAAHHIIDPRTGQPAQTDVLTATAIAPTVMQAEVVAKTLLILGSENAMFWLDAHPEFDALLVLGDGQVLTSENIENYL